MENKIMITVMMMVCLVGLASAYYPGEVQTFPNDMNSSTLVYTIIDNSTAVNLNITIDPYNVTITFPQDMIPDSFTIVLFEEHTNEVVKTIRRGGSSSTRYVDRIINQTVYQPKYVDRIVNKTQTKWNNSIEYVEVDNDGPYNALIISLILILVAIAGIATHLARRLKKMETEDESQ